MHKLTSFKFLHSPQLQVAAYQCKRKESVSSRNLVAVMTATRTSLCRFLGVKTRKAGLAFNLQSNSKDLLHCI